MTAEVRALFERLKHEPRRVFFPLVLPDRNTLDAARREFIANARAGQRFRISAYERTKQELGSALAGYARRARLDPVAPGVKALVASIWYEPNNRRDPDNVISGGRKLILDALGPGRDGSRGWPGAGVLRGDGRRDIAAFFDIFRTDPDEPGVEVTIAPVQLELPLSRAAREVVVDLRAAPAVVGLP